MSVPRTSLGPYTIVRPLGEGRFGEVFLVSEPLTGAWHVAKVLKQTAGSRTEQKSEFRLLGNLDHPNLLIPWGLEEYGGELVLLMQHVDGVPFDTWVQAGPDREARLRRVLPQLLSGLGFLHHHGVLHFDIKPANVLVSEQGHLHLLDFGLSRSSANGPDDVRGTFAYLAPEVLTGGGYGKAADLFAVGVMCFEALTGTLPFAEGGNESFTARLLRSEPAPLALSDVALGGILRRMMEPRVDRRPSAEDSLAWLGSEGIRELPLAPVGLVGRQDSLQALHEVWADVRNGQSRVVQVVGNSGMGKTALVEHFCDATAETGVVLSGRCFERDATPYKGLDSVMARLGQHLATLEPDERASLSELVVGPLSQLFPELGQAVGYEAASNNPLPPGAMRQRAISALRRLFARFTRARPVLLWLDDVQWGDRGGAMILLELLQAPAPQGLMVVLSHRPVREDPGHFLGTWLRGLTTIEARTIELPVLPLPADEARQLAHRLLGSSRGVDLLVEAGEGCPFILEVLARAGAEHSGFSAEQTLATWISELEPVPRRMLEAICLAGRPLLRQQVPGAPDANELPAAWSALLRRRLVRSVGGEGRVEPYHDRIRRTVLRMLGAEERIALHARLGHLLAAPPHTDPEGAAQHLVAGNLPREARPWAVLAAEQANEALAFDRAAQLYELAVRCCGNDETHARDLREHQARALADAGQAARAGALFLQVARSQVGPRRLRTMRQAMEQLLVSGNVERGRLVMGELLSRLGVRVPRGRWLEASLAWELFWLWLRGPSLAPQQRLDERDALVLQTSLSIGKGYGTFETRLSGLFFLRAARQALRTGQAAEAVRGIAYVGSLFSFPGTAAGLARAENWLRAGERIAASRQDEHGLAVCRVGRGIQQISAGRWQSAVDAFDAAVERMQQNYANVDWESDTARNTALLALWQLGDLAELERLSARLVTEGARRGDVALHIESALYHTPALVALDRPAEARAHVVDLLSEWQDDGYHYQHWIGRRFLVLADLYQGAEPAALEALESDLRRAAAGGVTQMGIVRIEAQQLRGGLALQCGRTDVVRDALKRLDKIATPYARAVALSLRAGRSRLAGDADAPELLQQALEAFAAEDMQMHALSMRLVLAIEREEQDVVGELEGDLRALGVVEPRRWATVFAPGWR